MILCDIGNTTFHFKVKKKDFKINIKDTLDSLKDYKEDIYFISVNEKGTKKLKDKYPNATDIKELIRFKTSYKGLGIDRQVVCSYMKDGIVIDVGSAITVDVMKNGIHKGGFILPGISAFKRIYPQISKKLSFNLKNYINLDKIPLKTNDAINYALFSSIVLPILKIYKEYQVPLYFTGGDAKLILQYFVDMPIKYKKNLIFITMKKIINDDIKRKIDVNNCSAKR